EDGHFVLSTDKGRYLSRAVIIAAGKGAFSPRILECPGYDRLLDRGVVHHVKDPAAYAGKRILIVGGGDSAVDWALSLKDTCERLILIHRREGFRAHAHSMRQLRAAVEAGQVELLTHKEVREVHGDDCVRAVTIFDNRTDEELTLEVDTVLALIGFKPDLGPVARWGIELEKNCIKVGPTMETSVPGVYAAGDIVWHQAKLELIATGFSEAAIAVNNAIHFIDPKARVNPGHSTNLKVFKEREAAEAAAEESTTEPITARARPGTNRVCRRPIAETRNPLWMSRPWTTPRRRPCFSSKTTRTTSSSTGRSWTTSATTCSRHAMARKASAGHARSIRT